MKHFIIIVAMLLMSGCCCHTGGGYYYGYRYQAGAYVGQPVVYQQPVVIRVPPQQRSVRVIHMRSKVRAVNPMNGRTYTVYGPPPRRVRWR